MSARVHDDDDDDDDGQHLQCVLMVWLTSRREHIFIGTSRLGVRNACACFRASRCV